MAAAAAVRIAPGDTSVASMANRVGSGTRASADPRIAGLEQSLGVSLRDDWRAAEEEFGGGAHYDRGQDGRRPPAGSVRPLAFRFAAGYVANEVGLAPAETLGFGDMVRGISLYESVLRFVANDSRRAAPRGQSLNRLF